ncbi:hypothetical protein CRENBAI_005887 [Crenichthys baileyi]|uniref:Uncharacterized protein n=1 Tax=Crenichthys baileyi TaxID=28760 RepID=A0AAV9RN70_9TELE
MQAVCREVLRWLVWEDYLIVLLSAENMYLSRAKKHELALALFWRKKAAKKAVRCALLALCSAQPKTALAWHKPLKTMGFRAHRILSERGLRLTTAINGAAV